MPASKSINISWLVLRIQTKITSLCLSKEWILVTPKINLYFLVGQMNDRPADATGGEQKPVHEDTSAVIVRVIGQQPVPLVLLLTGAVSVTPQGGGHSENRGICHPVHTKYVTSSATHEQISWCIACSNSLLLRMARTLPLLLLAQKGVTTSTDDWHTSSLKSLHNNNVRMSIVGKHYFPLLFSTGPG